MELRQKTELRRLLVPQLRQSLQILALPQQELKATIQEELDNNPFLEEHILNNSLPKGETNYLSSLSHKVLTYRAQDSDFRMSLITQKTSLQDALLRQLGMFADDDKTLAIGQEIIGNLDENGYLKATLMDIAQSLDFSLQEVERVLILIQQFEPAGVAARSVAECLLIQLKISGENDPLLERIIECHLEDIARKDYRRIAKSLKAPLDAIEPLIKKIVRLNPKPGRNYSQEETQHVIPDLIFSKDEGYLKVTLNNDDSFSIRINETYRSMLKNETLEPSAKEFLSNKLRAALDLVRAVSRRQETLKKIVEALVDIQQEAILNDFSCLRPLTFKEIAQRIGMHETTVCRAVMNKYAQLPQGNIVSLKSFFSNRVRGFHGESFSAIQVKMCIKESIAQEDKKQPLSDLDIATYLSGEKKIKISRRTVAKYREELKLLSSSLRRLK